MRAGLRLFFEPRRAHRIDEIASPQERTIRSVSTTPQLEHTPAGIREIRIAHSPDSDDAFMFYGLATNKVRVPGLRFTHTLTDIETLNQKAIHEAFYDVTAISFHAYP